VFARVLILSCKSSDIYIYIYCWRIQHSFLFMFLFMFCYTCSYIIIIWNQVVNDDSTEWLRTSPGSIPSRPLQSLGYQWLDWTPISRNPVATLADGNCVRAVRWSSGWRRCLHDEQRAPVNISAIQHRHKLMSEVNSVDVHSQNCFDMFVKSKYLLDECSVY